MVEATRNICTVPLISKSMTDKHGPRIPLSPHLPMEKSFLTTMLLESESSFSTTPIKSTSKSLK